MHKSKFIDIIRTFSPEELKNFRDFIHSPFHNKNKKVRILFEIVKKFAPKYESDELQKRRVFKLLYPGKEYNDIVMRILLSDLLKLSEEYLTQINYSSRPLEAKKFLLDELKTRKLDRLFARHIKQAADIARSSGINNHFYFFDLYDLENIMIDYLIAADKQRTSGANVIKQGEYLICFSLIGLLHVAHELLTQEEVLNLNFEPNMVREYLDRLDLENFIKYLEETGYEYYQIVAIYYYMYRAFSDDDNDENYFKLKRLIDENLHLFGREEKFNLLVVLESCCVTKLSGNKSGFYEHLMELYEFMLSENLYTHREKDFIQTNLFRNIFFVAVTLKKYQWAEKFINDYIDKLIPGQRPSMKHFACALLDFERGRFENALEEITKVDFEFFVFKFDVKVLMLKIYYEVKSYEPALSLIDSFNHFLVNNKSIYKRERERFGNFAGYLKVLIKISNGSSRTDIHDLKNKITDSTAVIGKRWLLEKVEQLNGVFE